MGNGSKSKDIAQYFEAKVEQLRPGEPIPFGMYLYFPLNTHLMQWKLAGEIPTPEFVDKYKTRGLSLFWIHNDERQLFLDYLDPPKPVPIPTPQATVYEVPPQFVAEILPIQQEFQTEKGKEIAETLAANIPDEQKAAEIAPKAQSVIAEIAAAKTVPEQKKATEQAREVFEDILRNELKKDDSILAEIWKLAKSEPDFEHGANVAMYATLIGMAFGKIQPDLINDLAFAGLLHDLGLSQFPHALNIQAWKNMDPAAAAMYSQHVDTTLDLLRRYAPNLPSRISNIINQHHEKFDGSGYPRKVQGFKIDDVAQLLAVADLIDSMCSGRWDGEERTLTDSFNTLEKLEKSATFPEHFNPEIFSSIVTWIRGNAGKAATDQALEVVKKQRTQILGE